MNTLALDPGRRHTGVAFAHEGVDIALPQETIHHQSVEELVERVQEIVQERDVEQMVIGLPLMMNGEEGEEAMFVYTLEEAFQKALPNVAIHLLDERETSRVSSCGKSKDAHAQAATTILSVFLEKEKAKQK